MKSMLLLSLTFFALVYPAEAQKDVRESCKVTTPPVIDGNVDEWTSEWMVDPRGKFIYNICNDDKNLYIRLKVSDDATQRKIGLFGLTVLLNPKGKKVGKLGLKYPIEKDMVELNKQMPKGTIDAKAMAEMKKNLVRDEQVLEFVGLAKKNITSTRLGLMNGLEVIITADASGDYIYEAKIPFKAFKIDKAAVKVLGVAFVTGKMPPPKSQGTAPAGGGVGNSAYGRGYGRGYGGYGGGGYGGYGGGMRTSAPQYNEFNVSTYLAVAVKLQ